MNDTQKLKQLQYVFDTNYTQTLLNSGPIWYIKKFVKTHAAILLRKGMDKQIINYALVNSLPKYRAVSLCALPFLNQEVFQLFRDWMSPEMRTLFDVLVWEDKLHKNDIKKRFNIEICDEKEERYYGNRGSKTYKIKGDYRFFKSKANAYAFSGFYGMYSYTKFEISLAPQLRAIICQYYQAPKGLELEGLVEIDAPYQYTEGERNIFLELPRIIAYASQGQIKTTAKGKPQAATLGKMQRKLNLKEYYPDAKYKDVKNLRTSLLAALIVILPNLKREIEPARLLKILFQDYYPNHFSSLHGVITYLKGTGYIDEYYTRPIEASLLKILSSLPHNEWISLDNLETNIKYAFYDLKIVSVHAANNKLYYAYEDRIQKDNWDYAYFQDKHPIDDERYYPSLILPLIKGTLFMFAAWGLLDVAYGEVDTEIMGKTCQSPYDGLRYVRLNNLGAYIVGKTPSYEVSESYQQASIKLSADSLTIITPENDDTAAIILEPYAERVSPNRYRSDYSFFLKECRSKKDLENRIKLFKQTIAVDLPPNWIAFFKELEGKINPLQKVSNISVLQIPANNQALIKLIARDKVLKNLCIKAEGYHILIKKGNMSKFKKRLQEFGYLLT